LQALDAIERNATEVDAKIVRLSTDVAAATDALLQAERQRAETQRQLEVQRRRVQARLRSLQRISQLPTLRFALSHKDFAESVAKDRLLRQLVRRDKLQLHEYRRLLADLDSLTAGRDASLRKLQDLDLELHAQKAKAEQDRRDKQAVLVQVTADRKFHERMVRDVSAADRELTHKIETLKDRQYAFAQAKGKMLPPVIGTVETPFGNVRNSRFGTTTLHRGVDYRGSNSQGQSVRAIYWGRVVHVGWLSGYGETIILDHGRGWHTVYAHLERITVTAGQVVRAREKMADMGQTGSLKGRYLYFEIRHNGQPVDPAEYLF
jgi:septal ring factor EnvC (AmiA/AmiB activator)